MQNTTHILVVEDDTEIQSLLAALLQRNGWTASLASNGREADAIMARSCIDLILLDVMLPEKTD